MSHQFQSEKTRGSIQYFCSKLFELDKHFGTSKNGKSGQTNWDKREYLNPLEISVHNCLQSLCVTTNAISLSLPSLLAVLLKQLEYRN